MPTSQTSSRNLSPATPGADSGTGPDGQHHTRGLLLVGIFKLSKFLLFGALGIASMRLMHRNLGDLVGYWTDKLQIDPEDRLVNLLFSKASLIGAHQLQRIGIASFAYAVVCLIEGTGLMLEKVWAEYITVTLTALALPWELYELVRRPSAFRSILLLLNIFVLAYLVWYIRTAESLHARKAAVDE